MDMPTPYSDDSEGPVLRTFVDESIAQERPQSPRSQHLAQNIPGAGPVDPGPSRQHGQIIHDPPAPSQELVDTDGSANELLRLITKQKQEIRSLRKALHVAKDRADSEAQRIVSMERAKTTEHFRLLNDNRMAAQQDAMKANSEMRLYQFQLENAQREITKAQDLLKSVQNQRDDAEEAAARARRKARKYLQEKMVTAAREEGRKVGFKAGLQRAQEEQAVYSSPRRGRTRSGRKRLEDPGQPASPEIPHPNTQQDLFNTALEEEVDILLSQRLDHLIRRQNTSPEGARSQRNPEPGHPSVKEEDVFENDSPTPPEPVAISYPIPNPARPTTPSVVTYPVSIPPASVIERQNSLNRYPGNQPHQWVTAQQYHELAGPGQQDASPYGFQSNAANMDMTRGGLTGSHPKRKESLIRKLTDRFRRKRKPVPPEWGGNDPNAPMPAEPTARASWYTPAPNRPPPIHVRDFAQTQPSADSVSVSTRMSQLELVSPPPDGSETSLKLRGRRKRREKGPLYVINEDHDATPVKQRYTSQIYQPDPKLPQINVTPFLENDSRYPRPTAIDERRTSRASVPREMNDINMPPRGPRRPSHLTVPARLAQDNATPSQIYAAQHSGSGSGSQGNAPPLFRRGTSSEITPIHIKIEGPSRSPSDAPPSSSHLENNFLSPHRMPGDLPSTSSLAGLPESPSPSGPRPTYDTGAAPALYQPESFMRNDGYTSGLGLSQNPPRPTDHIQTFPSSLNYAAQSSLTDHRPSSQQWPHDGYSSRPPDRPTPKVTDQPLPETHGGGGGGDRASIRSRSARQQSPRKSVRNLPAATTNGDGWGPGTSGGWGGTAPSDGPHRRTFSDVHRTPTQTPLGSTRNLPPMNGGWGGTARSDGSHKRAASDAHRTPSQTPRGSTRNLPATATSGVGGWGGTARSDGSQKRAGGSEAHLTPGPSGYAGLPVTTAVDDEKTIHRVPSNLSIRSTGSRYAKFDSSTYVDPAFFTPAESVEPNAGRINKGKGVDRSR